MDFLKKLDGSIEKNNSLVCVGLDPVLKKLPDSLKDVENPFFTFNKAIIDSTKDLVCCYKPNTAFYEALGINGISQLKQTCDYIHETCPEIPVILDAKRADIGNTNEGYVSFAFDYLYVDAVTLHPYLGKKAIQPFLERKDKGCIILCRTSNEGAGEFQDLLIEGKPLYMHISMQVNNSWNENQNCLLVVGATYPKEMKEIRKTAGDMVFLVPGVGAQGGSVVNTMKAGLNSKKRGLIISSSRGIIFASGGADFAERAREEAEKLKDEINKYR